MTGFFLFFEACGNFVVHIDVAVFINEMSAGKAARFDRVAFTA